MKQLIGVALVLAGALLLAIAWLAGWTSSDLVLLSGLLLIILGTIVHVRQQKSGEKY